MTFKTVANPFIERTPQRPLRALWPAAHVERKPFAMRFIRPSRGYLRSFAQLTFCVAVGLLGTAERGYAEEPSIVQYVDGALFVAGERFLPDLSAQEHAAGTVLVATRADNGAEFEATLGRLGLRVVQSFSAFPTLFVVSVPVGYETQWVAALAKQPTVKSVGLNRIARPT